MHTLRTPTKILSFTLSLTLYNTSIINIIEMASKINPPIRLRRINCDLASSSTWGQKLKFHVPLNRKDFYHFRFSRLAGILC